MIRGIGLTLLEISSGVRGQTAPGLAPGRHAALDAVVENSGSVMSGRECHHFLRSGGSLTLHGHRHPCLYRDAKFTQIIVSAKSREGFTCRITVVGPIFQAVSDLGLVLKTIDILLKGRPCRAHWQRSGSDSERPTDPHASLDIASVFCRAGACFCRRLRA